MQAVMSRRVAISLSQRTDDLKVTFDEKVGIC